jgi:hypothetical protein
VLWKGGEEMKNCFQQRLSLRPFCRKASEGGNSKTVFASGSISFSEVCGARTTPIFSHIVTLLLMGARLLRSSGALAENNHLPRFSFKDCPNVAVLENT